MCVFDRELRFAAVLSAKECGQNMIGVPNPAKSDKRDPGGGLGQLGVDLVDQRFAVDVIRIAWEGDGGEGTGWSLRLRCWRCWCQMLPLAVVTHEPGAARGFRLHLPGW